MSDLKQKTITGSFWSLFERFGYLGIQFVSNLVLARLLMPSDFGTVGVLIIFTTLSAVLIDSGLSTALVQRKSIKDIDISTVFYTNLALAFFVYIVIFFSAPLVSVYFRNPDLTVLLRTIELMVIIDAFAAIQSTLLIRSMNFKRISLIKIWSIIIAVAVSIVCAMSEMGVWSLVIQYLTYSILRALSLWFMSKWRPLLMYSVESFKSLFSFGSRLLLSSFVAELYNNFQSILIGRYFPAKELGLYTQARQLQQIPVDSLSRVVNQVSLPAYAQLQDNTVELVDMLRKNIKVLVFVNTPLMILLAIIAQPLLIFLYSMKWVEAVPYFQFLCLGFGILLIVHQCSLTALKAVGHSDYVLRLEIIKKIIGITLLILGINYLGIWGVMTALAINSIIELFLNGYYLKKSIGYGSIGQIRDILPSFVISILCALPTYYLSVILFVNTLPFVNVVISAIVYATLYILLSYLFKVDALRMVKSIITGFLHKK